ncbi:hypothetical protein [Chryseolinea lacunae]|uniref:Uncharacterized protein n=1 Tax=Chryseolinea lacunae TaxID=2801331 RepID=A0ABS1KXA6_9BACT|nr:hypothetical protein [Chryseolinea lacunae]MBL0743897.1 hypothetical protein [Chryseolinea lacunae]
MERISLVLAVKQYVDTTPKLWTGNAEPFVRDENIFTFPISDPASQGRISRLKGYQYLLRVQMFYRVLMCRN